MDSIRLDKYISVAAAVSRSDAKSLIKKGRVTVNESVVKTVDAKVSESDKVTVDNKTVIYKKYVYLIMNKPQGILSASTDKKVKTVVDIVPEEFKHYDLFPVGRLDKDTTGLLLITNDGDFAHRIISPKSNIEKKYWVELDGAVTDAHIAQFESGVILADNTKCMPAKLMKLEHNEAEIIIREGKYHQVKRMFGTVGLGVNKLKRLSIGNLELPEDITEGCCRELTEQELQLLL